MTTTSTLDLWYRAFLLLGTFLNNLRYLKRTLILITESEPLITSQELKRAVPLLVQMHSEQEEIYKILLQLLDTSL